MSSAVQVLDHGFTVVSRRQEIRISRQISCVGRLRVSPDVNLGHCHATVKSLPETRTRRASNRRESPFQELRAEGVLRSSSTGDQAPPEPSASFRKFSSSSRLTRHCLPILRQGIRPSRHQRHTVVLSTPRYEATSSALKRGLAVGSSPPLARDSLMVSAKVHPLETRRVLFTQLRIRCLPRSPHPGCRIIRALRVPQGLAAADQP